MTVALFALTALLWGGGALATALQAGVTPAPWSVALRMALAGLLLLIYGRVRHVPLAIPSRDRFYVVLQGALFFALAFISFYEAARRIPSGLAALVLSTSSLFAALFGRILLGSPLAPAMLWGALCGIAGIGIIFGPNTGTGLATLGSDSGAGFAWALVAAIATGGGTVAGARNQQAGLPTVAVLGWGALIGAVVSACWAMAERQPFVVDLSPRYLGSLLYLAVAASCVTFMLYFELVRRLGPGRAAYTLATVPLIALVLSALFENLHLDGRIAIGAMAILLGNVLVLRR
jgi:drug/metabolite transporter (DMT)-like permease